MLYFRKDVITFQSIPRVLKGLNSNTYNYLEANKEALRIRKVLNNYPQDSPSLMIMAECIRFNKPCKMEGVTYDWDASKNWVYKTGEGY